MHMAKTAWLYMIVLIEKRHLPLAAVAVMMEGVHLGQSK